MQSYKNSVALEKRISESNRIITKYPNHIPVIIDCDKELSKLIKKKKYLVPFDSQISYLLTIVRTKISIGKEKALFMFYNNSLVCPNDMIGDIYNKNKLFSNDDKFLYFYLTLENTFG